MCNNVKFKIEQLKVKFLKKSLKHPVLQQVACWHSVQPQLRAEWLLLALSIVNFKVKQNDFSVTVINCFCVFEMSTLPEMPFLSTNVHFQTCLNSKMLK